MGIAQYDPASIGRPARTAGRMVGVKKSLKQRQLWAFRFFLEREGRMRDRALFDLAIDRKLRGCDLEKPKIGMLVNGPAIRTRAMVVQQKTSRPEQFEITADVDPAGHLSNRQHARLVDEWVTAIGMQPQNYGTHSLRRTTAAMIYKVTGNLRAVQILLGHTKIKNAFRYLGLDIEDALELAEHTET
ncbi:MAG: tyrosine-type recombinase/integrase [Hyphomonas sp.]|nr:tyrosine-type recombinase/integrase [Hyphomonas sp.]